MRTPSRQFPATTEDSMGAVTNRFDTIIVGALALPWVYLIVHLFFFEGENRLQAILDWIDDNNLQAIAGILLFAMTYTLGSAIERVAQDFFNDDDLRIPGVFRMTITEDRIIASVVCDSSGSDRNLIRPSFTTNPVLRESLCALRCPTPDCVSDPRTLAECINPDAKSHSQRQTSGTCPSILGSSRRHTSILSEGLEEKDEDQRIETVRDIFGLQENGLLLKGEDATTRLRLLHDQIMVLRGTTFNGMVAFALCLFALGVRARREQSHILHAALAAVPAVFLLLAILAGYHHLFVERNLSDPPYMEVSLFLIGVAGALLLWRVKPFSFSGEKAKPGESSNETEEQDCILGWNWPVLSAIFAVLFVAGVLGWWATEVFYTQQVIYSYDSQLKGPTEKGSPGRDPEVEESDAQGSKQSSESDSAR
jgi:hypothetical protein